MAGFDELRALEKYFVLGKKAMALMGRCAVMVAVNKTSRPHCADFKF